MTIKSWFESGCDYASGVDLYSQQQKCNLNLLKVFKKKESIQNLEKLKYELKKILQNEAVIIEKPKEINKPEKEQESQDPKKSIFFHELPEELRPVLLEAHDYFKKNCLLKTKLNELPEASENKALQLQLEIDHNWKKNKICWTKIDHYLTYKKLPKTIKVKNPFSDFTPAALVRRQQQLYSNRSRTEKRLKENRQLIKNVEDRREYERLNKLIIKQENTLIKVNQDLTIITAMIDGK